MQQMDKLYDKQSIAEVKMNPDGPTVIMIVGIIVGLLISFRAMIKYNKGIF